MKNQKAYMIVANTPFQLSFRLFLPEFKKAINLIFTATASAGGIIAIEGSVSKHEDLSSATKRIKEKNFNHYVEDMALNENNMIKVNKIISFDSKKDKDNFFKASKGLLGELYEKTTTHDGLKQARLKQCFGR